MQRAKIYDDQALTKFKLNSLFKFSDNSCALLHSLFLHLALEFSTRFSDQFGHCSLVPGQF